MSVGQGNNGGPHCSQEGHQGRHTLNLERTRGYHGDRVTRHSSVRVLGQRSPGQEGGRGRLWWSMMDIDKAIGPTTSGSSKLRHDALPGNKMADFLSRLIVEDGTSVTEKKEK
ncbi:hypothetical protein EYF80_034621 [Liparis tanakae]|uniref:Uncharacterized protein n=1 Tax=Liparis tanakae TaxID=230148 RepID=A0A4Z2GNT1_9TELE|nr:hypothetical protein EYF80_034621 [Liparis tanakae]